jgi:DNA-directed RNA polymerase specialized sigma24 family protein
MRQDVTYREAECLELYFVQGYTYEQISQSLHINVSTICRNIQRGEQKMNRVLNFARELMGGTLHG